jgi:hypothetical protein
LCFITKVRAHAKAVKSRSASHPLRGALLGALETSLAIVRWLALERAPQTASCHSA